MWCRSSLPAARITRSPVRSGNVMAARRTRSTSTSRSMRRSGCGASCWRISTASRTHLPASPTGICYSRNNKARLGNAAAMRSAEPLRMTQTSTRLLADIRQLAPQLAARAGEFEAARRIPPDIVDLLRSIGLFRMFVPRSHDGLELDVPSGLEVIAALARIDGSLGWTAATAAVPPLAAPLLPRATYDAIYSNGPDVHFSASAQPAGTAERTVGGWRVTGRWPFLSGCDFADWIFCVCTMTENGKRLPGPAGADGPPMIRGFALPAKDWMIEDTWYVAGLGATGSHHGVLKDVFVPDDYVVDIIDGVPCQKGAQYQAVFQILPVMHAAVHVGIAEG